jgi:hypothetical protein
LLVSHFMLELPQTLFLLHFIVVLFADLRMRQVLLTHFMFAKTNTAPADVFDFGQLVSFLFTFFLFTVFPPAYYLYD